MTISLTDLNNLRTAPVLQDKQKELLIKELLTHTSQADWFTVGIMAPSSKVAISSLREIERFFNWPKMKLKEGVDYDEPVFLKGNQKTGDIYIRNEYGLGEGILISCQYYEDNKLNTTLGPFPLDLFSLHTVFD